MGPPQKQGKWRILKISSHHEVILKLLPLAVKQWSEKSGSYIKPSFSKISMQRNRLETYQNLISAGPIRMTAKEVPREEKASQVSN
jgi:hypothetical protein